MPDIGTITLVMSSINNISQEHCIHLNSHIDPGRGHKLELKCLSSVYGVLNAIIVLCILFISQFLIMTHDFKFEYIIITRNVPLLRYKMDV